MRILLALVLAFGSASALHAQTRPKAALADSAAQVVYVDVRTPAEFAAGHVKGAVLIPVEQLQQRWKELERYRGRPIVLYCRTGRRAGVALDFLQRQGFTKIENGLGLEQMAARGLKIETGAAR